MGEKRDKLDIVNDILVAIMNKGGKIKPTHLLYKSNLSHEGMKKYISELKEKGMISEELDEDNKSKKFLITEHGFKFLEDYKKVKAFTSSFGF